MIKKIFPYRLQLQIFQLDEYVPGKFLKWISAHLFTRTIENKKPLVMTQKAKSIYYLAILLSLIDIFILTLFFKFSGFIISLILATQAYIFILIAYLFLFPLDIYRKNQVKRQTEEKILSLKKKNLKVIGITGSYGKTSVKEFLYQILRTEHSVLRTPESYNTPYGIAKVVDLELDDSYKYFICEMGAYRIGEIKEICDMVHPKYGVLTGINEQHLETFGSLENTTKTKFELIESLPENGFGIINIDNPHIKNNYLKYNKKLIPYGFTDEKFSLKNITHHTSGSEFILVLDGKEYHTRTRLLGKPNIQNILAAATMSFLLGIKPQSIVNTIAELKPVPHRLEIKKLEELTIIDDAYNSNVNGFKEAIVLLETFKEQKILVTPGIVDLGNQTLPIHKELGKILDKIDYIFLVGTSERTKGLQEGIAQKNKIIEIDSIKQFRKKISELHLNHPVVLLENDLPDSY
jgi:UDP-N-acetylmuramoyl-tripeptide--D-alanyl-D-alanine ligase